MPRLARTAGAVLALAVTMIPAAALGEPHVERHVPVLATRMDPCTIVGTPKADRLVGTNRADVICGRGGKDVLIGRGGGDLLIGGAGADEVRGGKGSDRLHGGRGGDVLLGGVGRDEVSGEAGDDDLDGGVDADDLDGGGGTNWCTVESEDASTRCVYDEAPPEADELSFSVDHVDLTDGDQDVSYRMHVIDDTGVEMVILKPGADARWFPSSAPQRVSGNVRDGWWEGTLHFNQWMAPGTFHPVARLLDRIGRRVDQPVPGASVSVDNAHPDSDQPEVTLLSPTPDQSFDLTSSSQPITITARITDAASGVDPDRASFIIWAPRNKQGALTYGWSASLRLESGNIHDGVWKGTTYVDGGAPDGRWNVGVYVSDRASGDTREARAIYWGPDEYPYRIYDSAEGDNRPLPDDMGVFAVIGHPRTDNVPPTVDGVDLSTDTVDTLPGPATIGVTLHAADAETGVDGIYLALEDPYAGYGAPRAVPARIENFTGSRRDGTWTATFTLPQGLPPGTYYAHVIVWDREWNQSTYFSSSYPGVADQYLLDTDPVVTVVDSTP